MDRIEPFNVSKRRRFPRRGEHRDDACDALEAIGYGGGCFYRIQSDRVVA